MNNTLYCIKGDTLKFVVDLKDVLGNVYNLKTGEFITFKVKQNPWDEDTLIEVESTSKTITVDPVELEVGSYNFELSITYDDGEVYTFIPASRSRLNVDAQL